MIDIALKLDDKFYEEETRDGYLVTAETKEIWAVQLDLLAKFKEVCDKHHIQYFIFSGSLLGVVRHKGYIPWDDDIDIAMKREEYNKLIKIADQEFQHPYFYQTAYSDKNYVRGHAQLRNTLTTGALENEVDWVDFNQGIFIDIFPLDGVIEDQQKLDKQERKMELYKRFLYLGAQYNPNNRSALSHVAHSVLKFFFSIYSYKNIYKKYEKCCAKYNDTASQLGQLSFVLDERFIWPRELFDEVIEAKLEGITVTIPKEYDKILYKTYGDYMTPVQGGTYHGGIIWDTNKPL